MSNAIYFRGETDETGTEFFVGFQSGVFCAESSAWFPTGKIISFCDELAEYPFREGSTPRLLGGIWNTQCTQVVQGLVEMSVKSCGARGQLSVFIRLTEIEEAGHRETRSAFASINASYEEIKKMRDAIDHAVHSSGESSVVFQDFV